MVFVLKWQAGVGSRVRTLSDQCLCSLCNFSSLTNRQDRRIWKLNSPTRESRLAVPLNSLK